VVSEVNQTEIAHFGYTFTLRHSSLLEIREFTLAYIDIKSVKNYIKNNEPETDGHTQQ